MSTFFKDRTAHARPLRSGALLAIAAVVGGCASFSPDGGFGSVQQTAKDRLGKVPRARPRAWWCVMAATSSTSTVQQSAPLLQAA